MRILLLLMVMLAATACANSAETSIAAQAESELNTPMVITTSSPVQEIKITEQPVTQEPEPTLTTEPTQAVVRADLEDLGPAPELVNETWLNTGGPLRLADLRGRVVLLEMWTFG